MANENRKGGANPIVTGAVVAGAVVAAVALSKKENREKARKMILDVTKKGQKLMERPEAKAVAGAVVSKVAQDMSKKGGNGNNEQKEKPAPKYI